MKNLAKEFKIEELSRMISEKTGYYVSLEIIEVKSNCDDTFYEITSQELKQHTGLMESSYDYFLIVGTSQKSDNFYYFNFDFKWRYNNGGRNGTEFGGFRFDTEKGIWEGE